MRRIFINNFGRSCRSMYDTPSVIRLQGEITESIVEAADHILMLLAQIYR